MKDVRANLSITSLRILYGHTCKGFSYVWTGIGRTGLYKWRGRFSGALPRTPGRLHWRRMESDLTRTR